LSDTAPSPNWRVFMPQLKLEFGLQLVLQEGIDQQVLEEKGEHQYRIRVVSASKALEGFV